ncbi:hypothetical protein D3C73_1080140 [compost metagenome]
MIFLILRRLLQIIMIAGDQHIVVSVDSLLCKRTKLASSGDHRIRIQHAAVKPIHIVIFQPVILDPELINRGAETESHLKFNKPFHEPWLESLLRH